ncbi:MAG TPA: HAMP domain-containing sensor histidine kinase [Longimicrobiaceae bacterium]|jgi:signal transduction histidine kinase
MLQVHPEHVQGAAERFLPHGFCYLWNRPLLWTHVVSDVLIGLSYVVISFALAYLVHRARRDIPFSVVFVAFGLFIVTCGMTHFVEVWTLWDPVYWFSGGVKVVTAAASVATAAAMPFTVPAVLTTIRTARQAREHEVAAARAAALEEHNELLQEQALELEQQREEAEALAEELEEANEQLRRALAEAEEARRAAEEADRTKSAFLATMSHELRTPLNAIIGYEKLLEEEIVGPVTDTQKGQLRRIGASAGHLLGLIDEILTLARIEAGREEVRPEPVRLGEVVWSAAAMVEPLAAARGLRFTVAGPEPDAVLRTDPGKLRQVLLNLLGNAVKFTDAGEVALEARSAGGYVEVAVRDTGPGIAPEHLERIWDAFWQVEQTTTRAHEGSGLGLAVSRRLAGLLGGEIRVESAPGRGSTFTVRLPAGTGADAAG